jgi:hypothetical protein
MSTNLKIVGLPEHNVLLLGDVSSQIVVNNSTRKIVGYTLRYVNSTGPSINRITLSFLAIRNGNDAAGIAPGSQKAVSSTLDAIGRPGVSGPALAVILDAVIFADGEVVGPANTKTFEQITTKLKAEQDIHQKLLASRNLSAAERDKVWNEVERASRKVENGPKSRRRILCLRDFHLESAGRRRLSS